MANQSNPWRRAPRTRSETLASILAENGPFRPSTAHAVCSSIPLDTDELATLTSITLYEADGYDADRAYVHTFDVAASPAP